MFNFKFKKSKKIFRFNLSDRICIDCFSGWVTLLLFFLVLNLTLIIFSASLYYRIDKGVAFAVNGGVGGDRDFSQINKEDLDAIIYDFSLKASALKDLKQGKGLNIVDPSW